MEGEILEFPQQPQPRGRDYSTGWMDGCAYGERWASSGLFCMGVFAGVMLAIIVGLLIFYFAGSR